MRVLGLDPSSQSTGFGLIESRSGQYAVLGYGTIKPGRSLALARRVNAIRERVDSLIAEHGPQEVAVENPFYAQNIKTAITLGQVRGAILVAVASHDLPLFEYSALEIKKAVTGFGQADKHQVNGMVRALLHLGDEPLEEDASDALATAICHINSREFHKTVEESSL
jgi:crossover junction endodeoxyribonuclease RuvC